MALIMNMGKPFKITAPVAGSASFRGTDYPLPHTFTNLATYEVAVNVTGYSTLTISNTHNLHYYGLKSDGTYSFIASPSGTGPAVIDVTDYIMIFTNQFTANNFNTEFTLA